MSWFGKISRAHGRMRKARHRAGRVRHVTAVTVPVCLSSSPLFELQDHQGQVLPSCLAPGHCAMERPRPGAVIHSPPPSVARCRESRLLPPGPGHGVWVPVTLGGLGNEGSAGPEPPVPDTLPRPHRRDGEPWGTAVSLPQGWGGQDRIPAGTQPWAGQSHRDGFRAWVAKSKAEGFLSVPEMNTPFPSVTASPNPPRKPERESFAALGAVGSLKGLKR